MYFDRNNNSYPDAHFDGLPGPSQPVICYNSAAFQPEPDHHVLNISENSAQPMETADGEPVVIESSKRLPSRLNCILGRLLLITNFRNRKMGNVQSLSNQTIRDKKRHEHAVFRARKNESLQKLNQSLDMIFGHQKRSLIETINKSNEFLQSSIT